MALKSQLSLPCIFDLQQPSFSPAEYPLFVPCVSSQRSFMHTQANTGVYVYMSVCRYVCVYIQLTLE